MLEKPGTSFGRLVREVHRCFVVRHEGFLDSSKALRPWNGAGPLPDGVKIMSKDVPDFLRRGVDRHMAFQLEMHTWLLSTVVMGYSRKGRMKSEDALMFSIGMCTSMIISSN